MGFQDIILCSTFGSLCSTSGSNLVTTALSRERENSGKGLAQVLISPPSIYTAESDSPKPPLGCIPQALTWCPWACTLRPNHAWYRQQARGSHAVILFRLAGSWYETSSAKSSLKNPLLRINTCLLGAEGNLHLAQQTLTKQNLILLEAAKDRAA